MISRFHIDNRKCMGCVSTVQMALNGLTGCENVVVDLEYAHGAGEWFRG